MEPDVETRDAAIVPDVPSTEASVDAVTCAHSCGGVCVDIFSDPHNCGSCGYECPSMSCIAGICVPPTGDSGVFPDGCMVPYYIDNDGDGYGGTLTVHGATAVPSGSVGCGQTAPRGFSLTNDDCNDAVATVHPHAPEPCDGVDENCDGYADNEPDAAPVPNSSSQCDSARITGGIGTFPPSDFLHAPVCMLAGIARAGYVRLSQDLCEICPVPGSSYQCECWDNNGHLLNCPAE